MDASIEILQVQKLVEGADDRRTKRGDLFFDLLDTQRFRHSTWVGAHVEHRNPLVRHAFYHLFPLELFTQAETAW